MGKTLRIVLAQLNLVVGDIASNLQKHIDSAIYARDQLSADVIVFPELGLTGYPPEDLLLRKAFINEARNAFDKFVSSVKGIYCVVSHPHHTVEGLLNSCSLVYNGEVLGLYSKQFLPNYGVFDEDRYFLPGNSTCVAPIKDIPCGLVICEDLWLPGPVQKAARQGARLIFSPNASPFEVDKHERRLAVFSKQAKQNRVPIIYVNMVGGQDDLVFDGGSMVINEDGKLCQFAGFYDEILLPVDIAITPTQVKIEPAEINVPRKEERIYKAMMLGVRDYIQKNNLTDVLIGVSGGIDSALTLAIAVDALGPEHVHAVFMPSRYTSQMSVEDAKQLTAKLGVELETISIEPAYKSFTESLVVPFAGTKADVTEENIQARIRAILLMALSNKRGQLVLTTGNRSELAVGYCTLYGDMAGGYSVLKDIPKTLVYELANYRNSLKQIIPRRIIDRPPSAELAPNQKDQDTLPPYPTLDKILECYINHEQSIPEIVAQGFSEELVTKVVNLIRQNEYKRRQSAVGPRINHKAFGKDRRYPIVNRFKG